MKKTSIEVGSPVTVTKVKEKQDELNKFAGWESTVLSIENGQAKITHPFGLKDKNESLEVSLDRLKILGDSKASAEIPVTPKSAKTQDVMAAVSAGDQVKTKRDWLTVAKNAAANSTTIVCTTSSGKERRVWRDKITEIKSK